MARGLGLNVLASADIAPGESHLYTNTGYVLLTLIVERVSGQSFQEFTREHLFEPAGMVHTQWQDDSRRIVEKRSVGYALVEPAKDGKPAKFEQIPTAQDTFGNGNLLTTVGDMQRWNAALSRNAFDRTLTTQLEEPARLSNGHVLGYARGEYVGKYRGHREVQHSGYNGTYTAWVGRYPEADLSVSLLCNSDGDEVDPHDIVDLFLPGGAPPQDPAEKKAAQRTKDLSAYSGVYRRMGSDQRVLWAFPQQGTMEGDLFTRGPASFEFDPHHPGRVVRHSYGNASEWTLLPVWEPALATLGEFQGRFTSDELLGSYDVAFDGKLLTITVSGLSELSASLQARAIDVFEAQGLPQMGGLLVVFQRDKEGRVSGLALAPDSLHEMPFHRVETN